jgi:hypothetical protein
VHTLLIRVKLNKECGFYRGMVKKEYEKLRVKYNLPSYRRLNNAFELDLLESDKLLLKQIKKRIREKFEGIALFIIPLIQPRADDWVSIQEYKNCSEKDRKELSKLLKKVMILGRKFSEAHFLQDDKHDAKFITIACNEWEELRKPLAKFALKLQDCWKKDDPKKETRSYLG